MNLTNPLDSIVFITLPESFQLSKDALHIDPTIPLPVQLPQDISPGEKEKFDLSTLTEEMILAGILTVLAYDINNSNIFYYRSIINNAKPNLQQELTEAAILQAEAKKQTAIKEAEGQSEAILMVNKATSEGIKMIREAGADDAVIKLKSLEAFQKAADGQATKIIIPSEIQGLAGLATSVKEFIKD